MKTFITIVILFVVMFISWNMFVKKQDELPIRQIPDDILLIYEETFETGESSIKAHSFEIGTDYGLTIVPKPKNEGERAARFELREDDPLVKGSVRAELSIVKGEEGHIGPDTWYSFDLFIPKDYTRDDRKELINQWYQEGDPSASINIKDDRFFWRFYIDGVSEDFDLGPVIKDEWQNFTIHMVHDYGENGVTELWKDDEKLLDLKGKNMNNSPLPKWKIGIYKSSWVDGATKSKSRVLYFDNIKVWSLILPKETKNGDTDIFGKISKLTFVNAETEKDYRLVEPEGTVYMDSMGTFKINIRADLFNEKNVGSVKFEISGRDSFETIDNSPPFALFGDDGNGNYYYGSGLEKGDYQLTVTSYTKRKGEGLSGVPYTISFSID
ncbi:polysaccharide lyase [Lunatibacter salilacus]|uniref:polysaccharide lyase n=1 Tax=Lunatibacter salilacus TaxID=2483804 RepID=UPI00131EB87F|nr:polysaccharide lyase [Lunatibacter salilacus]